MPFCLSKKSWPLQGKADIIPLPADIYKSKEKVEEKGKIKLLKGYDERRLFYVASSRAKSHLIYTATPEEKVVASEFFKSLDIEQESGAPGDEEKFLAEYLERHPQEDNLEGTSGILKDIVENLTLNPTSLNNYITCRRKFLYDNVLMLPGRKNQHLVFGNCAHKALEEVYTAYMESKKFPSFPVFKKEFKRELEFQGVSDQIKKWCVDRLETLSGWYKIESASPVVPVDLENKLEVFFPEGLAFRGAFDKIEKEQDGTVRVIDYKTGKPDDHVKAIANCRDVSKYECDDYYRQLIAYKLLYEKSGQSGKLGKVAKGVLQFLEPVSTTVKKYNLEKGNYHNEVVELDDSMVSELEKLIMSSWRDIQELKFDKLPERDGKERCARCEFDSICWG
jgi:CRISPR/Cas system-associated exonuclease Cas4 (RecB family)